MYDTLMNFESIISRTEKQARQFVWWSPSQIARGEDISNDPTKGQRAWSVPRATGEFLHAQILELKPKVILEFGTSLGYSTLWIGDAARAVGARVWTIEHFENKFELAKKNIFDAGLSQIVTCILGKISDVLGNEDDPSGFLKKIKEEDLKIDFIFMDADRGHYHEYFPLLEPYLAENATIIADNAENMGSRMQPFFDLLREKKWEMEILDLDNGILVAKRGSSPL